MFVYKQFVCLQKRCPSLALGAGDLKTIDYIFSGFNEFKPRLKSPENRFLLSAGLNLEKLKTIINETNHI